MNKALFIAVHPDDETLGCGGTILKHKAQGDEIYWMTITNATKNHPLMFSDEFVEFRSKLVDQVSEAYGFTKTFKLDFPTQMLQSVDLKDLIVAIDSVINDVKPNIIYMPFRGDVHSDHRISFEAIYACTKSFRKPFLEKLYMLEALSETEFSPAISGATFVPNVYVDITEYIEQKLAIMSIYEKEIMAEPYPRSLSSIKALTRTRGSRAGVMYAEAFMLLYERR